MRLTLLLLASVASAQDFSEVRVEKLAAEQKFTEGPVWSLEGFLLFSETVTDKIQKFTPGKGLSEFATRSGGVNGNAFDEQGRLYTCEFRERRVTRLNKNGKIDVLASRFEGKRLNAPNDIVVRRDGIVFFTDPAFGNQQDSRELDFYGVFRINSKGELDAIARWKTRPDGIALSPNGRVLYVSDPDARAIRAYDLDKQGAASNEKVVVSKIPVVPGGIRTDEKGNIYIATKGVSIYSPSGQFLKDIFLPEAASNVAFGDPDFQSLYVTTRTSVYRVRLPVKGSLPYAP
jgi:gluconolactonase